MNNYLNFKNMPKNMKFFEFKEYLIDRLGKEHSYDWYYLKYTDYVSNNKLDSNLDQKPINEFAMFNMNNYVHVKLTEYGRDIYKLYQFVHSPIIKDPEVDEEGYSSFQLWKLMQIFGSHTKIGTHLCFEPNIKFYMHDVVIYE